MSLIPLGFWAASGGAAAGATSFDLLATEILASSQSSVTFSSLGDYAADYQHLQIRYTARSSRGDTDSVLFMRFNGDSAANYNSHNLAGTGSSVISANYSASSGGNGIYMPYSMTGSTAPTGVYAASVIDVLDPFETNKNTTMRAAIGQVHSAYNRVSLHSGLWRNTASVTSISFHDIFGSLVSGSRFSLYGLKGA